MYLALLDFYRGSQGATDAAGELRPTDRRLFPRLSGKVAMLAYDENGDTTCRLYPPYPNPFPYAAENVAGVVELGPAAVPRHAQNAYFNWCRLLIPSAGVTTPRS